MADDAPASSPAWPSPSAQGGPASAPPRWLAAGLGAATAAVAALVLAAWAMGWETVKSFHAPSADWPTMKANTAVGFLLCGIALASTTRPRLRGLRITCAAAAALLGVATLSQYVTGHDLGIDQALFVDHGLRAGTTSPGRMAILTAGSFALLGTALAVWRRRPALVAVLATLVVIAALFNLAFFFFGALPPVAGTRMAVHTTALFLLVAVGSVCAEGQNALARAVLGASSAARATRWIFAASVALPFVLGALARELSDTGVLDLAQASALEVFLSMVLVTTIAGITLRGLAARDRRAREAEQRANEQGMLLTVIADNIKDTLTLRGPSRKYLFVNKATADTWGVKPSDIIGTDGSGVYPASVMADVNRLDDEVLRTGTPHTREIVVPGPAGPRTFLTLKTAVRDATGTIIAVSGMGRDITQRKEAERMLEEAESRFRALFDDSPVATVISRADGSGIAELNHAYERLTGYSRQDLLAPGFDMDSLLVPARSRAALLEKLRRERGAEAMPIDLRRKDGAIRSVLLWVSPIRLNGADHFLAALQDMTEQREVEAAVQRAQERFARIFAASPVAITLTHSDGRFADANEAFLRMVGRPRAEVLSPDFTAYQVWRRPADRDAALAKLRRGEAGRNLETEIVHRDGHVIPVEMSIDMLDVGGQTMILTILSDITQRLAAERERRARAATQDELERIRRTQEFRTQFINSTAHELATPLTPLVIGLSILRAKEAGGLTERQEKAVEAMARSVDRLRTISRDMVEAARLQSKALALERAPVDLAQIAAAAVESERAAAARAGIDLVLEAPGALPAECDGERIRLALGHLLGNALKFTPRGGRVVVRGRLRDGEAAIEVEDTGIGLTAHQITGLWRPYAQAHDPMEQTNSGVGLGLYVTRGIIELHGGHVGVHSPGPGKGSTFWFSLPARRE